MRASPRIRPIHAMAVAWLACFVVARPLRADLRTTSPSVPDANPRLPPETWVLQLFPDGDLFSPPVASPKEPRFSLSYERSRFSTTTSGDRIAGTDVGLVGAGTTFGLVRWARADLSRGVQFGLFGAVFSEFDLDRVSKDLVNVDYQIGLPLSARWAWTSLRFRYFHQSSHLGDEFLLNHPGFERVELSLEAMDLAVSFDAPNGWARVYGLAGSIVRSTQKLGRLFGRGGMEIAVASWELHAAGSLLVPVAAFEVAAAQEQDWDATVNAKVGLAARRSSGRIIRILASAFKGRSPFGQFARTATSESIGLHIQFEP